MESAASENKTGNTLEQQLAQDEQRAKMEKEIAWLERLARAEKQPKKKFELACEVQKLTKQLKTLFPSKN